MKEFVRFLFVQTAEHIQFSRNKGVLAMYEVSMFLF